jgi:putative DNA primase/helicase
MPTSGLSNALDDQVREWGEPEPFATSEPVEIPADILPGYLGEYAAALSRSTQTPPAFSVAGILAVLSVCLQRKYKIQAYESGDYTEPINVWTLNLSPPGTRKSAIVSACIAPLNDWQRQKAIELAAEIRTNKRTREVFSKRIEALTKAIASHKIDEADRNKLMADIDELDAKMPMEVFPPTLMLTNVTMEALQGMLADHGGKAAIVSDEGGIFATITGLYSGGRFSVDDLLSGHSGGMIGVLRQKRRAFIKDTAVTMGLSVQPGVLADMPEQTRKKLHGVGMMGRFLFFYPESNLGFRDSYKNEPVKDSIKERYYTEIIKLLNIVVPVDELGMEIPQTLKLSHESREIWLAFSDQIEKRLRPDGDLCDLSDWAGKLPGQMARVAGLLSVAINPGSSIIEAEYMARAAYLGDLLASHAMAAYGIIRDDGDTDAAAIYRWMLKLQQPQFTEYECQHHFRKWKKDRLDSAFSELHRRNILSESIKVSTGGRDSIIRKINPAVTKGVQ